MEAFWIYLCIQPLMFLDFLLKNTSCVSETQESHSFTENLNHRGRQLAVQAVSPGHNSHHVGTSSSENSPGTWPILSTKSSPQPQWRCYYPHFTDVENEAQRPYLGSQSQEAVIPACLPSELWASWLGAGSRVGARAPHLQSLPSRRPVGQVLSQCFHFSVCKTGTTIARCQGI